MSGLGEAVLEGATDRKLSDEPAIVEMARSISGLPDDTKMTLVPTGPLTNITLFPCTHSGRADRIDRIVLMGGTTAGGNTTVYAEFMGRPRGCADCGLERASHRYVPPRCDPEWRLRLCLSAILGHIRSTCYETRSANFRYCVRRHLSIVAA